MFAKENLQQGSKLKQAPKSLQLDQLPNNERQDVPNTIIPFLSPLILPPASFPTPDNKDDGKAKMKDEIEMGKKCPVEQTGCGDGSRWKHSDMSVTMPDSSSLYSCFMSQCTIADSDQFSP